MLNYIGMPIQDAVNGLKDLGAKVETVKLSTESLTPEELEGIQLNVVIAQTPDSGTYYIQSEGKVVTLTYYE